MLMILILILILVLTTSIERVIVVVVVVVVAMVTRLMVIVVLLRRVGVVRIGAARVVMIWRVLRVVPIKAVRRRVRGQRRRGRGRHLQIVEGFRGRPGTVYTIVVVDCGAVASATRRIGVTSIRIAIIGLLSLLLLLVVVVRRRSTRGGARVDSVRSRTVAWRRDQARTSVLMLWLLLLGCRR